MGPHLIKNKGPKGPGLDKNNARLALIRSNTRAPWALGPTKITPLGPHPKFVQKRRRVKGNMCKLKLRHTHHLCPRWQRQGQRQNNSNLVIMTILNCCSGSGSGRIRKFKESQGNSLFLFCGRSHAKLIHTLDFVREPAEEGSYPGC